jgi:hypothetical protein
MSHRPQSKARQRKYACMKPTKAISQFQYADMPRLKVHLEEAFEVDIKNRRKEAEAKSGSAGASEVGRKHEISDDEEGGQGKSREESPPSKSQRLASPAASSQTESDG